MFGLKAQMVRARLIISLSKTKSLPGVHIVISIFLSAIDKKKKTEAAEFGQKRVSVIQHSFCGSEVKPNIRCLI